MIDNDPIDTPKADVVSSVDAPSAPADVPDESSPDYDSCQCCCCTGSCRADDDYYDQEVFD